MFYCSEVILEKYFAAKFSLEDTYIWNRIKAKYLFMPILSEPDHLIYNAFQRRQKSWV